MSYSLVAVVITPEGGPITPRNLLQLSYSLTAVVVSRIALPDAVAIAELQLGYNLTAVVIRFPESVQASISQGFN